MENLFLTADAFEGRLNMNVFSNFEKSINENDLQKSFPSDKFALLEKSDIDAFIRNVYEQTGGDIKKGGFNDTKEVSNLIKKAKGQLQSLKPVRVKDVNDQIRTVYVLEKANEDQLKKGQETNLEKGKVSSALYYGDAGITFTKKGADIIDRIGHIKRDIQDDQRSIEKDIDECLEHLTTTPTQECKSYETNLKCPYKVFPWSMTYFEASSNAVSGIESSETYERCNSKEEADMNNKYNDLVYRWKENAEELQTIKMYEENLDSNINYELSARQMISLGF